MLDELLLSATRHITEQYANNPIETDQNAWNPDYGGCTGMKQLGCVQMMLQGMCSCYGSRTYTTLPT
jgi:hypothetical protein